MKPAVQPSTLDESSDTTSVVPPEVKVALLAHLPRTDLLQVVLVSHEWRDLAKADARLFLGVRFASSAKRPLQDVMNDFETRVDYAIRNRFWLKITFSAERPYRNNSTVPHKAWMEEVHPLVQQLCRLLPRAMPRTVAMKLSIPRALWSMVNRALILPPAPVLRALELSLPELRSRNINRLPKVISSNLFAGDAPFLRALNMAHFAICPTVVDAFRHVHDLHISINDTDQRIHGHGTHAVKLSILFPRLENIVIDHGDVEDTIVDPLFNLTGVALRSLDTWRIGEDSPNPVHLLTLSRVQYTNILLSRITHYSEFVDTDEFTSHLAECRLGSAPIALEILEHCREGSESRQLLQFNFVAHAVGVIPCRERVFSGERDIYESGPDLDVLAAAAFATFSHDLVSLTINMDFLSVLESTNGCPYFPALESLEIQVHSDWDAWSGEWMSDVAGKPVEVTLGDGDPLGEKVQLVLLTVIARNLRLLRLCALDSQRWVAPKMFNNLHRMLRLGSKPPPKHPLALELHGILVGRLPPRPEDVPFAGFDGGVSRTDRITSTGMMRERYSSLNVYMGEDFKDFGLSRFSPHAEEL